MASIFIAIPLTVVIQKKDNLNLGNPQSPTKKQQQKSPSINIFPENLKSFFQFKDKWFEVRET